MTGGELNATQIRALLHEPGRRLQAAGAHGDIKLVGAAALILQGIGNRPTADIDPSYADPDTIHAVVADMATDDDLAPDWLNTNAAAFVPDNATWIPLEQLDGLTIQAADTETLLAMKLDAERDKRHPRHRPAPAPIPIAAEHKQKYWMTIENSGPPVPH